MSNMQKGEVNYKVKAVKVSTIYRNSQFCGDVFSFARDEKESRRKRVGRDDPLAVTNARSADVF